MPRAQYPMPADFPQHAAIMSSKDLAVHYGSWPGCIARWRRICGIPARITNTAAPAPANFAALAPTMTRHEAQAFFGRGEKVVQRWAAEHGVKFRKTATILSGQRRSKVTDTQRDMTRAGQAAEFLQRFGPVFRCEGTGRQNPKGKFWRRGNAYPLTDADIIERAEFKGFDADAWKRIPTTHTEGARA